jgi:hypothetical protein
MRFKLEMFITVEPISGSYVKNAVKKFLGSKKILRFYQRFFD